jgi:hypothetical protein
MADVDSRSLMMGYKSFMVEIGLYGNTMDHNYKAYQHWQQTTPGTKMFGSLCITSM